MKVPRHLGRLVESGRLTPQEADRLREADEDEIDEVVVGIRARHATARLEAAVAAGDITTEDADRLVERLRAGEHSPELRAQLNRLARSRRSPVGDGEQAQSGWSA